MDYFYVALVLAVMMSSVSNAAQQGVEEMPLNDCPENDEMGEKQCVDAVNIADGVDVRVGLERCKCPSGTECHGTKDVEAEADDVPDDPDADYTYTCEDIASEQEEEKVAKQFVSGLVLDGPAVLEEEDNS